MATVKRLTIVTKTMSNILLSIVVGDKEEDFRLRNVARS